MGRVKVRVGVGLELGLWSGGRVGLWVGLRLGLD